MKKIAIWQSHEIARILSSLLFACISVIILFGLINIILPHLPEPIGSRSGLFIIGARFTLLLTLIAGGLGLFIGTGMGLARVSDHLILRSFSFAYVLLFQGTPLLVQVLFIYYALPALIPSLRLGEFSAALVALALNVGAYNAEVIRAGILAIPRGQSEASRSLGLSQWQTMRWVILPQAFRIVIPPLLNNVVALLKDSSLASSIGLLELTLAGNRVTSETFQPTPVLTTVAAIYLILTLVLSVFPYILKRGALSQ